MAQLKAAVDVGTGLYRVGRSISGALNTASTIANIASILGLGKDEEGKHFDPRDNDPFDDGDIQDNGVATSDLDRVNPQITQPGGYQSVPQTEAEDQQWKLGKSGAEPLSEEEMIQNYRPDPATVMQEHVRNYLMFDEAHRYFAGDSEPQFDDEEIVEAIVMDDDDSIALLSDFGEIQPSESEGSEVPGQGPDIRRVNPEQSREIFRIIRSIFPNMDTTTTRRLTKAVIILGIVKQIPFTEIKDFIKNFINSIWEWTTTHTNPPPSGDPGSRNNIQELINTPLPPQCQRKIFYRHGKVVSVIVCADERGVRYYEK